MSVTLRLSALVLACAAGFAAEPTTAAVVAAQAAPAAHSPWLKVLGEVGSLVLGIIQLVVALGMAAFCITKGLQLLSRLLGGVDIWAEIKKKNLAVALLAAGVVIAYTGVIGSGIKAMTDSLMSLGSGSLFGGAVGLFSGLVQLVVAVMVASFAITVVFRVMDKLTENIDEKAEFLNGNTAIGVVYCGIMIGVSQLVAAGVSGIGRGLSRVLNAVVGALFG